MMAYAAVWSMSALSGGPWSMRGKIQTRWQIYFLSVAVFTNLRTFGLVLHQSQLADLRRREPCKYSISLGNITLT